MLRLLKVPDGISGGGGGEKGRCGADIWAVDSSIQSERNAAKLSAWLLRKLLLLVSTRWIAMVDVLL